MKRKRKKTYFKDEPFLAKIGSNIRKVRLAKGLTQMELAFACNEADYSQINRMELGKINFSVSYLALVAKALRVSPKELLS